MLLPLPLAYFFLRPMHFGELSRSSWMSFSVGRCKVAELQHVLDFQLQVGGRHRVDCHRRRGHRSGLQLLHDRALPNLLFFSNFVLDVCFNQVTIRRILDICVGAHFRHRVVRKANIEAATMWQITKQMLTVDATHSFTYLLDELLDVFILLSFSTSSPSRKPLNFQLCIVREGRHIAVFDVVSCRLFSTFLRIHLPPSVAPSLLRAIALPTSVRRT